MPRQKTRRTFGETLAAAIDCSGLTQAEVARRAGLTPQNLHKYLSGERRPVEQAQSLIDRLAAALDLDPANLWPAGKITTKSTKAGRGTRGEGRGARN